MNKFHVIIPARMHSTRLPHKMLSPHLLHRAENQLSYETNNPKKHTRAWHTNYAYNVKPDGFNTGVFLVSAGRSRICHFKISEALPLDPVYNNCFDTTGFEKNEKPIDIEIYNTEKYSLYR